MCPDANMLDFTNLAEDLHQASKVSGQSVHQMMMGFAVEIQADAQSHAPVLTGKLRSMILITDEPGRIIVGVDSSLVLYAPFQEYGTKGPYEIKAKTAKALAFKMGGKTVLVKKVMHPGIKSTPYIRPAMADFIDKLGPAAADVGVNLVTGVNDR